MFYEIGNNVFTPGIFRNLASNCLPKGALFLLHLWAESGLAGTERPNSKRVLFVYSILSGGNFAYRFGNYAELLGNGKAEQLCYMASPMDENLQGEVFASFQENKLFSGLPKADFKAWAERNKWPLHVSWSIQHLLNWDTFAAARST